MAHTQERRCCRGSLSGDAGGAVSPEPCLSTSSTFCRVAKGIRNGNFLRYRKGHWQETALSVNSICLAGLETKAHRLREQTSGVGEARGLGGRVGDATEEAKQEISINRAGSSGAHCQGQVANPFNVFVSSAKPMRLGLHVENAWRRG